jgi:hypothetical protein
MVNTATYFNGFFLFWTLVPGVRVVVRVCPVQ